jgi:hypothetical protein
MALIRVIFTLGMSSLSIRLEDLIVILVSHFQLAH